MPTLSVASLPHRRGATQSGHCDRNARRKHRARALHMQACPLRAQPHFSRNAIPTCSPVGERGAAPASGGRCRHSAPMARRACHRQQLLRSGADGFDCVHVVEATTNALAEEEFDRAWSGDVVVNSRTQANAIGQDIDFPMLQNPAVARRLLGLASEIVESG